MKTPKLLLLPLAGLLSLTAPSLRAADPATPPPPPPPGARHERREEMRDNVEQMKKELNLTAEQQVQVDAIHQQTGDALKALRNDTSLTEEQRRAKARELRKSTEDQVQALLTPEQKAKAKELRKKHGKRGPGGPAGPGAHPPGAHPPGDAPDAK